MEGGDAGGGWWRLKWKSRTDQYCWRFSSLHSPLNCHAPSKQLKALCLSSSAPILFLSFTSFFHTHPPPPPACGSVSRFFSILSLAANSVFPIFFSFSKLRSSARKINVAKTSVTVLSTRLNDFINCICQGTAYCHVPQRRMYLAPN